MELALKQTGYLFWIGNGLYLLAFFFALSAIRRNKEYLRNIFYSILGLGFGLHSLGIYFRGLQHGVFPLTNPLEIIQVIAWITIFLTIIIQCVLRHKLLAFFGSGLAGLIGLTALLIPSWDISNASSAIVHNPWIGFHVAMAIFAYGTFGLLAVGALMFLLQDYALEEKRFGAFFQMLPSLKQMDELMQRLLLVGFVSLTVAVGMGTLIWIQYQESLSVGKLVSTWGIWLSYLALIGTRSHTFFTQRFFAWCSLILFLMALLSLWPSQAS